LSAVLAAALRAAIVTSSSVRRAAASNVPNWSMPVAGAARGIADIEYSVKNIAPPKCMVLSVRFFSGWGSRVASHQLPIPRYTV